MPRGLGLGCCVALALVVGCSSTPPAADAGNGGGGGDAGADAGSGCSPECATGSICQAGACVPTSQTCPSGCGPAQVCVNGLCVDQNPCGLNEIVCARGNSGYCANLAADRNNCGNCGLACPSGEVCARGACAVSCLEGEQVCGNLCVDLQSDSSNCGACGTACPSGQLCSNGVCGATCASNYTTCGVAPADYCAQPQNDPDNCGSCATACGKGLVCSRGECAATCTGTEDQLCSGICVDEQTDGQSCGACGMACAAAQVCSGGACATSCAIPLTTCTVGARSACANLLEDTSNCGACGAQCATAQVCDDGQCADSCQGAAGALCGGLCVHLGSDNRNCGACGNACAAGSVCNGYGVCAQTCGTSFNACGAGSLEYCADLQGDRDNCGSCAKVCAAGLGCTAGTCAAATDGGVGDAGPDGGADAGPDAGPVGPCTTTSCASGCTCPSGEVCNGGTCETGCLSAGTYFALGAPNPANACQSCQPVVTTAGFSAVSDGDTCTAGGGNFCQSGSCVFGCYVGPTVYGSTALNPGNDCQSCQPALSTSGFTALATGTACNQSGGSYCNVGSCVVGCYIGGAAIAVGAQSPAGDCQTCQPPTSVNSYSPVPEGTSCNFNGGDFCHAGSCANGCFIGNAFYASGAANPQNSCQVCTPAKSSTNWTTGAAGSACGTSGGYCSSTGNCIVGCEIGGTVYNGGKFNPAGGGCCLPSVDPTNWTPELSTAVGYATGNSPSGLAIADLNGDGLADVVVANSADNDLSLFLGQADGGLRAVGTVPTGHTPVAVTVADFNDDGIPDLAVSDRGDKEVAILLGQADGGFAAFSSYPAGSGTLGSLVAAQVFGGKVDPSLIVSNGAAGTISVLPNSGTGTFNAPQSWPLVSGNMAVGTLAAGVMRPSAGLQDIIVPNDVNGQTNGIGFLFNLGGGPYGGEGDYPVGNVITQIQSVAVADFNGDGFLDVAGAGPTSFAAGGVEVWLGTGNVSPAVGAAEGLGAYSVGAPSSFLSLATGDLNNDGYPDIVATGNGVDAICVFLNQGVSGPGAFTSGGTQGIPAGVFSAPAQLSSPGPSIGVADFNGDGLPDVVVLSQEATVGGGGTLSVLYNQCP